MDEDISDYDSASDSGEEMRQEDSLNLSASQLVNIMTCAIKRKAPNNSGLLNKRKKCIERSRKQSSTSIERCKSPLLLPRKSREELIQRNKYLERRVKELEKLNHNLQLGLAASLKKTIIETLTGISSSPACIPSPENTVPLSPEELTERSSIDNSDKGTARRTKDLSITSVTSTSKTPEIVHEATTGLASSSHRLEHPEDAEIHFSDETQSTSHRIENQIALLKKESHDDGGHSPVSFVVPYPGDFQIHQGGNTFDFPYDDDRSPGQTATPPNMPTSPLLQDKRKELSSILQDCKNYKKLTNKLLNLFFDREELACSTLTGRCKNGQGKYKLDEATVDFIINQAILYFPGTTPSEVRTVISQKCKDKALYMNRFTQQANKSVTQKM